MKRKIALALALIAPALALTAPSVRAADDPSKPMFEIYGFLHLDWIRDFDRVDPAWIGAFRPSKIGDFGSDGQSALSVRQSKLGAQSSIPTEHGAVYGKFEFDMFGVGVDAGQTTIRLRHAFGEWNGILAGQTNNLFQDIDIWPNVLDYWGPAGMVFLRSPQLRYTPMKDKELGPAKWTGAFGIMHPATDVDTGQLRQVDPALGANLAADNKVPDLAGYIRATGPKGSHVQLASILRRLGVENTAVSSHQPQTHKLGYGFALTSNVKTIGESSAKISALYGEGIASYMNDGGVDLAPRTTGTGTPTARAVPLFGLMFYYDHWWNKKWSSTFGYSRTEQITTDLQTSTAFQHGQYASGNAVYRPVKDVFFGLEFLWGQRRSASGDKAIDRRLQFSAHYDFSTKELFAKLTR